jgi:hypothetical protein
MLLKQPKGHVMQLKQSIASATLWLLWAMPLFAEDQWPELPATNGSIQIPAQEWPLKPGPRQVKVTIHYPGGKLEKIDARTGMMLSLHNWGGTGCVGTADPLQLVERYNVVCLCVDYLQSGKQASIDDPEPYDFGYLQALDALRALYWLDHSLTSRKVEFARKRVYATGGSGGGNVTLMVNKLAPRTFACCIDICGMAKLSDDIAFNLPGGSDLNARYSRDKSNPYYLSPDHQELRYVGNPAHLKVMRNLCVDGGCRVIVVHGAEDRTCPVDDALEMVTNLRAARFKVDTKFVSLNDLDGEVFTGTGHSLGNRTLIVQRVSKEYLFPNGAHETMRFGRNDFECRDEIIYPTTNGRFVISYANGYPVGRFEAKSE